jgi:HSP20 family protein
MRQIEQRAYQIFESRSREDGHDLEDWLKAEQEFLNPIKAQITEEDANFRVRANTPGFEAEELEINVEPQNITIKGFHETQVERKEGKTKVSGLDSRQIYRTIPLPGAVLPEKATARLKEGVLEIVAEKAEQPKRISARAA